MGKIRDKNKSGKRKQGWLWESFGAGSGVMGMSLIVSLAVVGAVWLSRVVLGYLVPDDCVGTDFWDSFGVHVWIEAVVGALSAGFVVFQLRNGEKATKHQSDVEKAEFILEYNRSFIENEKMTDIERYLDSRMTGDSCFTIEDISIHRQDMINYLVYLEGLASCILDDVLDCESVDDLLAYRFFLAMNHPEVQSLNLLPYATYYRGCFQLYEKWRRYRQTCGKYNAIDHWDIPYWETELAFQHGYDTYAIPQLKLEKGNNFIRAKLDGKVLTLMYTQNSRVQFNGSRMQCIPERKISEITFSDDQPDWNPLPLQKKFWQRVTQLFRHIQKCFLGICKNFEKVLRPCQKIAVGLLILMSKLLPKKWRKRIAKACTCIYNSLCECWRRMREKTSDEDAYIYQVCLRAALKELLEDASRYLFVTNNSKGRMQSLPVFSEDSLCLITVDDSVCGKTQIENMCKLFTNARDALYHEGVFCHQLTDKTIFDSQSANLKRIAQLIYDTDPYIYPDMLGENKEIAAKVLEEILRQGRDPMFRLGNIYVCMVKEQVVGIILWQKGSLHWSPAEVTAAFERAGKNVPPTLPAVAEQFTPASTALVNPSLVDILNVCVAEEAQGNSIGTKMLTCFLEEHRHETCRLCVLRNNIGAIKLYQRSGFRINHLEPAYPSRPNHTRYVMIKPKL